MNGTVAMSSPKLTWAGGLYRSRARTYANPTRYPAAEGYGNPIAHRPQQTRRTTRLPAPVPWRLVGAWGPFVRQIAIHLIADP